MKRNELILMVVLGAMTLPVAFLSADWAGVFLIYISVALLFLPPEIRENQKVWTVSVISLIGHHLISITNTYFFTLYGADVDAIGFHLTAQELVRSDQPLWFSEFGDFEVGAKFYRYFLAGAYSLLGDSLLVGQGLSIVIYVLSSIIFLRLARSVGQGKWLVPFMVLYGLLPPALVFTSITMREVYQMLFFLSVIYWTVKFKIKPSLSNVLMLSVSAILLALMHNGLVVYALFLICFSLFWGLGLNIRSWTQQKLALQMAGIVLIAGIFFAWFTLASNLGGASRALISGEGTNYTENYREHGEEGRANYSVHLNASSPVNFLATAPVVFVFYMFTPFPWQVRNPLDVYAMFEAWMRMLLVYHALAAWWRAEGLRRSQYGYLLVLFFSLEFLWSLGTANYGTAMRHHLVAYGLLLIVGGPGMIQALNRLLIDRLPGYKSVRQPKPIRVAPHPAVALGSRALPPVTPRQGANELRLQDGIE